MAEKLVEKDDLSLLRLIADLKPTTKKKKSKDTAANQHEEKEKQDDMDIRSKYYTQPFRIWATEARKIVAKERPEWLPKYIIKWLGRAWKTMSPINKKPYQEEVKRRVARMPTCSKQLFLTYNRQQYSRKMTEAQPIKYMGKYTSQKLDQLIASGKALADVAADKCCESTATESHDHTVSTAAITLAPLSPLLTHTPTSDTPTSTLSPSLWHTSTHSPVITPTIEPMPTPTPTLTLTQTPTLTPTLTSDYDNVSLTSKSDGVQKKSKAKSAKAADGVKKKSKSAKAADRVQKKLKSAKAADGVKKKKSNLKSGKAVDEVKKKKKSKAKSGKVTNRMKKSKSAKAADRVKKKNSVKAADRIKKSKSVKAADRVKKSKSGTVADRVKKKSKSESDKAADEMQKESRSESDKAAVEMQKSESVKAADGPQIEATPVTEADELERIREIIAEEARKQQDDEEENTLCFDLLVQFAAGKLTLAQVADMYTTFLSRKQNKAETPPCVTNSNLAEVRYMHNLNFKLNFHTLQTYSISFLKCLFVL